MSILFRLAGNPEYGQARVPAYAQAIGAHFAPVRNHEAVRLARELRESNGVSYDAVMSLAIHVEDAFSLNERVNFDSPSLALDRRWKGPEARKFLEAARRFVTDSRFRDFVSSVQPLYNVTNARLRALVEKQASLAWFDRFFGVSPGPRFVVAPGLGNGGGSYGSQFLPEKGPVEIWAIPGVNNVDAEGWPRFDQQMLPTLVHEFCHSYVNPLVDRYAKELERSGPRIYDPVKEAMNTQAYGNWRTVFYESLVRAATARYVFQYSGEKAALPEIRDELARSFLWTAELFDLLAKYENSRDRYPTLESFMPRIVEYFDGLVPRLDDMIRRYEESRPRVVSMSPANGSENVDPSLTEIVFRFDKPIVRQDRHSIVRRREHTYPKVEASTFDDSCKVFTMRVQLEPNHLYEFSLNGPTGGSFKTEDAIRLKMYVVRFHTGSTKH